MSRVKFIKSANYEDSIQCGQKYIRLWSKKEVQLDGYFSPRELRKIADLMEKIKE